MYDVATNEMDQIDGALIDRLFEKARGTLTNEESVDVSAMVVYGRSSIENAVFRTSRNIFTSEDFDTPFKYTKMSVGDFACSVFNVFALN